MKVPEKVEPKAKASKVDEKKEEVKAQPLSKAPKLVVKQQPKDKLENELAELKNMISKL